MLGRGFRLVQPLKAAIMPLVQPPVSHDGQPHLVQLVHHDPHRANRSLKYRGIDLVKLEALFLYLSPRLVGFPNALFT